MTTKPTKDIAPDEPTTAPRKRREKGTSGGRRSGGPLDRAVLQQAFRVLSPKRAKEFGTARLLYIVHDANEAVVVTEFPENLKDDEQVFLIDREEHVVYRLERMY